MLFSRSEGVARSMKNALSRWKNSMQRQGTPEGNASIWASQLLLLAIRSVV